MEFKEKLNLIMAATGLSNSALARALALDASLISRWRAGTRVPAKNSPHLEALAQYLASLAKMDYRKAALCEIMGVAPEKRGALDKSTLAEMLHAWLSSGADAGPALIKSFMGRLEAASAAFASPAVTPGLVEAKREAFPGPPGGPRAFFGTAGKKCAAAEFLRRALAQSAPADLLMYSEESMNWMTDDRIFLQELFSLLSAVLARGHRVKIVHVLNRGLTELSAAIDFWLPLYLTGRIEPYYCPRYRDHYFRHTVFIAPGAAVTSCALAGHEDKAITYFCTDPQSVNFLTAEFDAFLNDLCRPLVRIYTDSSLSELEEFLTEFYERPGDCIYMSKIPSCLTMPKALYLSLLERTGLDKNSKEKLFISWHQKRKAFIKGIEQNYYTEISILPPLEEIVLGQVRAGLSGALTHTEVYYRPHEYAFHLESIAQLLQKHKKFFFVTSRRALWQNVRLLVKDGWGAVVVKTDDPPAVFTFSQPSMVNAFYCYLEDLVGSLPPKEKDKTRTAAALTELAEKLRRPPKGPAAAASAGEPVFQHDQGKF